MFRQQQTTIFLPKYIKNFELNFTKSERKARADPEQCCWGVPELLGGASSTARSAVEQVRPKQREALAEGAAAGVWGRKNRSPRVLECT